MVTPRLPSRAILSASCDLTSASQKKKLFLTPKRQSDKAGTRKSEAGYEGYTVTRNFKYVKGWDAAGTVFAI